MKETGFHQRHEDLTQRLYDAGDMLPGRYVFVLTTRCNLSCPFCPQTKRKRAERMRTGDWLNVLDQMPDYARVTLTGGEPLMFNGVFDVAAAANRSFHFNVITNGVLLTEEIVDRLLAFQNFKVLSVSIDTIGGVNRALRPAQWDRLVRMMRYFRRRRDEVRADALLDVKTLILDENADELLAIHRFMAEAVGCDTQAFQLMKGSPLQHADVMSPIEASFEPSRADVYERFDAISASLERIRQYSLEHDTRVFLHPKYTSLQSTTPLPDLNLLGNSERHEPGRYAPCMFPWASVHINDTGDLFPCQAVGMGNVREQSLADIIQGERMQAFRNALKRLGTTQGCNRCGWLRPAAAE